MMEYLRVRNWDKFQHYKDRNPPWIKLQRSLLHDYQYQCLQDASKAHLVGLWLLASQTDNKIPNDPEWVARQIGATEKVDLKLLIDNRYIECYQDASKPIAKRSPEAEAEAEEEKDIRQSESKIPACPHDQIIGLFHQTCKTLPSVLSARWPGSKSEKNLRARWKEHEAHQSLEFWQQFFEVVNSNPFWLGDNDRQWQATLHWLLERRNFDKVMERWANKRAAA